MAKDQAKDVPHIGLNYGPKDQEYVSGAIIIMIFVTIWLSSMCSPFFIVGNFLTGHYIIGIILLIAVYICYMPWGRSAEHMRPFFARGFQRYFRESSLLFEDGVPHKKNSNNLYCVHPHGIFCMGWSILFSCEEMQNVNFLFASVLYKSPFFQLLTKLVGCPAPADKLSFQKLMKEKKPMALIPGGFEEATIHSDNKERVYLKTRCGFVKYALENGYSLTPTYCFGESQTYSNTQGFWKFRFWLNSLGLPAINPFGTWFLPLLPRAKKMHVVVGKPITAKSGPISNPTKEQVMEFHAEYCTALEELFNKHKKRCGEPDAVLEFW